MQKQLLGLVSAINEANADGIVITSQYNRMWLTGLESSAGYIFLNKSGKGILIIDSRYIEVARSTVHNLEVRLLTNEKPLAKTVADIMLELNINKPLLEAEYLTLNELNMLGLDKMDYIPFQSKRLRIVKTDEELDKLQKAADIAAKTQIWIRKQIKPGMTEKQIANMITSHMLELGATGNSFDPIVASGINGSMPHANPSNKKVVEGEMITLDFGCYFEGYASDITRSFIIGGVDKCLDKEMITIWNHVQKAQALGVEGTKAGVSGLSVDKICRDYIDSTEYKGMFGHGTGHGVGLQVHELPNTNSGNAQPLPINSVVTIEPGIYKPGVGGVRIEDTVVVKGDNCIILTGLAPISI